MGGHGAWDSTAGSGWIPLIGIGMQFAFLAAILAAGYLVFRAVTADRDSDPALEELRLAYAHGELTDDEYETRREVLEEGS
ncbi:SHOCT domain-containing protein [Natronomonas sp. LN261]|uniref:SHOCT domain-containing protein n=1 Tax=Natronomonas sp. LN261 TaxID=2750669 RepID=UPI002107EA47|nr:SHOCT domain-containing protein [Natronomonas sp. LN261]